MNRICILFLATLFLNHRIVRAQEPEAEIQKWMSLKHLSYSEAKQYIADRNTHNLGQKASAQTFGSMVSCGSSNSLNIGFEQGNYNGWNIQKGTNLNSLYDSIWNVGPITNPNIIITGGDDPLTSDTLDSPFNGSKVIRLNDAVNNYEVTNLNKKFLVTQNNTLLKTAFLVVMNAAGHECAGQPYFRMQVLNCSRSNVIDEFLIIGNEGACNGYGISLLKTHQQSGILTTGWKKMCFDLRNYVGEEVELNVIAGDCIYGGHYCYAYLDAEFGQLSSSYQVMNTYTINGSVFNFSTSLAASCFPLMGQLQGPSPSQLTFPGSFGVNTVAPNSAFLSTPGFYNIIQTPVTGCDFVKELHIPVLPTVSLTAPAPTVCPYMANTYTVSGNAEYYVVKVNGVPTSTYYASVSYIPLTFPASVNSKTITVVGYGGSLACKDSSSVVLQVVPQTTLSTFYSPTVCAGTTTVFASGAVTYSWNLNNSGGPPLATTSSFSPNWVGPHSVFRVIGTDAQGCITAPSEFTVNGVNAASITHTVFGNLFICQGDSVLCNFSGGTTYNWSNGFSGCCQYLKPTLTNPGYIVNATGACSTNSLISISFNVLSAPNPGTFTVNLQSPICAGTNFTAQGYGGNFYFKYGNTGNYNNPTSFISNSSNTTFTASAIAPNGCMTHSVMNLNFAPVPVISGNSLVCAGQTATLNAFGASSYTWNFLNTGSTAVFPNLTQNATIYLSYSSSLGCVGHVTVPVIVEKQLISASVFSNNLCIGSNPVELNAMPFVGAGTYSWSNGALTQSISVNPTVTTTYSLFTNSALCGLNTSTYTLSVNPVIVSPVSFSTTPVCVGKVFTVTAAGASSFVFNGGPVTNANTFTVLGSSFGSNAISALGIYPNGCLSYTNGFLIPGTAPNVSVGSVGSPTICLNGQATWTVNGAASYTWSNGTTGSVVVLSPNNSTSYQVTGTSTNGCTYLNSNVWVTVVQPPVISIFPASPTVCLQAPFTLTASAAPSYQFLWNTGINSPFLNSSISAPTVYTVTANNGICSGSKTVQVLPYSPASFYLGNNAFCTGPQNNISYTASPANGTLFINGMSTSNLNIKAPGVYTLSYEYKDTNNCVLASYSVITVNPLPCIKLHADKYEVCEGELIQFTGTPAGGNYFGTTSPPNGLVPLIAGIYTVSYTYTDLNGCSGTSCMEVLADVCMGTVVQSLQSVRIYPNPTTDDITIENPGETTLKLSVFDLNGKLLFTQGIDQRIHHVRLEDYSKGMYFLVLQSNSEQKTLKLVKN